MIKMTDLRKSIKCNNCGNESTLAVSSEMDIKEVNFSGRCRCGSSLQITYGIVGEPSTPVQDSSSADVVNIDESLFSPEIPSDALRDIMDE